MTGGRDRRTRQRFDCEFPVQVISGEGELYGRTVNLSLGGMLLQIDPPLGYGERVTVRFRLPALAVDTEVEAIVRWSGGSQNGLQFGSMRARDVWALNRLFKTMAGS